MAVGFVAALANSILNHLCGRGAWSQPAGVYVKLHLGDPGASAAANAAAETTRKQMTFGSDAATGAISNTSANSWTSYPAAETVTHFSLWDAATGGNPLWTGVLTASKTMAVGETLTVAIGDLDLTLTPLAA